MKTNFPPLRFLLVALLIELLPAALPPASLAHSRSHANPSVRAHSAALAQADFYALQHLSNYGGMVGTLAISGTLLYTSEGSSGLTIYDLRDPLPPARRARIDAPATSAISLAGQYAYLAGGLSGLHIIDVQDPSHPVMVGAYFPNILVDVVDVAVQGRFAYIVTHAPDYLRLNTGTFEVLDISQPASPTLIKRITIEAGLHIRLSGDTAYVAGGSLLVFDIHAPANASLRARYMPDSFVLDVQVAGGYAYLSLPQRIEIVALPAKGPPTLVGRYAVNNPTDLQVMGQRLYVAASQAGMQIIDIATPATPKLTSTYAPTFPAARLAVAGQVVYLTDGLGFQVIDVADATQPILRAINHVLGYANRMWLAGGLAYVATSSGLQIVDLRDEANPQLLGMLSVPYLPAQDVQVVNELAYVVGEKYLRVADIHDPLNPVLRGSLALPGHGGRIQVIGSFAYVAGNLSENYDEANGLQIIDVSNPSQPTLVGSYPGAIYDIAVVGTLAYLAAGDSIEIVDISNPAAPVLQSSYLGIGFSIQVVGETAYITGKAQFQIANLHDPLHPMLQSSIGTGVTGKALVVGSLAYLTTYEQLSIIDVQNPTQPILRGGLERRFGNVQVLEDRLYGAQGENGLAFFRLIPLSNRAWIPKL